jgi:rhodanese-related sulfurtransferase
MQAKSQVTAFPPASSDDALRHFESRLGFETDCWDVHHSIENDVANFVLIDVRSPELYRKGHVPTAINLPTLKIKLDSLPRLNEGGLYVVYCAGPHCNGANKAAIRIARLGLPVKEMIGGAIGWVDEGYSLVND